MCNFYLKDKPVVSFYLYCLCHVLLGVNSLVEAIYTLAASIEDRRTSTSGQAGKHRKLIGRKVSSYNKIVI